MSTRSFSFSSSRPACAASCAALLGQIDVVPAGEQVLDVPDALAVAHQNQFSSHVGLLISRELAHGFHSHRQRGEIARAGGAHFRERALPMRQFLTPAVAPTRRRAHEPCPSSARQYAFCKPSMNAHSRIPQAGPCDCLPRALDRQLLDLLAQPVEPDARADLEIRTRRLGNTDAVGRCDFNDVERGIVSGQARHARGQIGRHTRLHVLLADLARSARGPRRRARARFPPPAA